MEAVGTSACLGIRNGCCSQSNGWDTQSRGQNVSFSASCNSLGFGLNAVAVTTPKVRD